MINAQKLKNLTAPPTSEASSSSGMRKAQAPPPTSENFVFELDAHGTRTTTSEQREVRLRVARSAWVAEEKLEIKSDLKSVLPFLSDSIEIAGVKYTVKGTSQGDRPAAVLVKDRQRQVGMVSERAAHDIDKAFQVALNIMAALKADGCVTEEAFNTKKEAELALLVKP